MGIVDESGKTPTVALREVGENLERLKHQSEDLLLLIEDEIRYIAKGGKPEVGTGGREGGRVGGKTREVKYQSEDLLLLIEDETRYIAKGGKPEVSRRGEGVREGGWGVF